MVQDCKRSPSSNAIKLSGKVLSIIYKIAFAWITTLESLVLTCKETQWTHLVLEIDYTHACVGRPIKPFFAPFELCYCLYHFFSCKLTIFLLLTQSLSKFNWFDETEKCVHYLAPCSSYIICQVLIHDWFVRQTTNTKERNLIRFSAAVCGKSLVSCATIQRTAVKQTSDLGMRLVLS